MSAAPSSRWCGLLHVLEMISILAKQLMLEVNQLLLFHVAVPFYNRQAAETLHSLRCSPKTRQSVRPADPPLALAVNVSARAAPLHVDSSNHRHPDRIR